ncbi:hypothetical protein [Clostridium hydrogeniformans]|uniref:hypothetical protein n=1 Tax=Clostridium hydrogeniformans TaxID=349933 RepID=UPI000483E0EE|nr:hypothetical protein [Clostridium hydrogeniformans]
MALFKNMIITSKGMELYAKAQAGQKIHFTKLQVGSGQIDTQNPVTLLRLLNPKLDVPITSIAPNPELKSATIIGSITNKNVKEAIYICEIGLYAKDPDEGEILYGYASAGGYGDYYAPESQGPYSWQYEINASIGNAANVTAELSQLQWDYGVVNSNKTFYIIQGSNQREINKNIDDNLKTLTDESREAKNKIKVIESTIEDGRCSFSTSNALTKLDNVQDGYLTDVVIKGRTLVNLCLDGKVPKSIEDVGGKQTYYFKHNVSAKGVYTIGFRIQNSTLDTSSIRFLYPIDGGMVEYPVSSYYAKKDGYHWITVNVEKNITNEMCGLYVYLTNKGEKATLSEIMVLKGDYTSSPPIYFEGIKSAGEVNYIDGKYIGKNLFKGEYQKKYIRGGDGNSTFLDDSNTRSAVIPIEAGGKYSVKKHSMSNRFSICLYNSIEIGSNATQIINMSDSLTQTTFTNTSNSKYMVIYVSNAKEEPLLLVEKGDGFSEYESYYEGNKIEILSTGKNLYRVDIAKFNGTDRIYTSTDLIYNFNEMYAINNSNKRLIFGISNKPNGVWIRDYIVNANSMQKIPLYSNEYVKTVAGLFSDGWKEADLDYLKNNIMVTSTLDTKQESYKSNKTEILLKEPLRGLPNGVADTINQSNALTRRIIKKNILSSWDWKVNTWAETLPNSIAFQAGVEDIKHGVGVNLICNKFTASDKVGNVDFEGITLSAQSNLLSIRIAKNKLSTHDITGFKKWLDDNEVFIYCEKKEPTIEQTNNPLNIRTFKDGYIQQNTILPATIEGRYPISLGGSIQSNTNAINQMENELFGVWRSILSLTDNMLSRVRCETEKVIIKGDWVGPNNECSILYEYLPNNVVRANIKCTEIKLNGNGSATFNVPLKFLTNIEDTYGGGGQIYRILENGSWITDDFRTTSYNVTCQPNGNNLITIWVDEVNQLSQGQLAEKAGIHAYTILKLK